MFVIVAASTFIINVRRNGRGRGRKRRRKRRKRKKRRKKRRRREIKRRRKRWRRRKKRRRGRRRRKRRKGRRGEEKGWFGIRGGGGVEEGVVEKGVKEALSHPIIVPGGCGVGERGREEGGLEDRWVESWRRGSKRGVGDGREKRRGSLEVVVIVV